jgi:hypothetical protein
MMATKTVNVECKFEIPLRSEFEIAVNVMLEIFLKRQ